MKVCDAAAHAHEQGVIHRDLKPTNIFLDQRHGREEPVIIDFQLAKLRGIDEARYSQIGELVGTPPYMSPEQCMGHAIDERSDLYSLGCTMYFALTGAPPFEGKSMIHTMQMHMSETPYADT